MASSAEQWVVERSREERAKEPSKDRPATTARFYTNFEGYERWRAYDEYGKYDSLMAHRLLAALEWGLDAIRGKEVHHQNGIPWDNRVENLELVTRAEHKAIHSIPTEELLDEIRAGADALGHAPSVAEMTEFGEYSWPTYYKRFGGWNDALEAAGLSPRNESPPRYSGKDLLDEVVRVGKEVGRMPTCGEFREHGQMRAGTVSKRFGSWLDALGAAREHPDWGGDES